MSTVKTRGTGHIRLLGLSCSKASFEQVLLPGKDNPIQRLPPDLSFQFSVGLRCGGEEGQPVFAELSVEVEPDEDVGQPYRVAVTYFGEFQLGNLPKGLSREGFMRNNAAAILFPYVRAAVADLTNRGGLGPLILPPLNVAALLSKEAKKRT